jgi:hypothetical protein
VPVATDELLLSTAEVEIQAAGRTPTVSILAYTGGLMSVSGWGPLAIDLAGIDASAEQIGILADHDASLKGIVGHGRAVAANGRLVVQGTITPSTEAARQVIELAKSGFRFQASVGVSPTDYERVRPGETFHVNGRAIKSPASGCTLVKAGVLKEVSIVAIGADPGTSVAIAATQQGNQTMSKEVTVDELRTEAANESERIHAIRQLCKGSFGEIEVQAIRDGWDVQRTELEVLRASRPVAPMTTYTSTMAPSARVMEAAILAHMGHDSLAEKHLGAQTAQQARDLRVTSLVDLCRAALMADGHMAPSGREAMIHAALSTMSLPVALGNAANKVLFAAYTESPASWRAFAAVKSVGDFKDHTGVRPSQTGDLEQVPAGGELKHGSMTEAIYKYSIDTFGKMISLDRRDIINDDLGFFEDSAASLGRAAMRSLSDLVYQVLLANAGGFFGAGNGNLDEGADTALDYDSLSAGVSKMLSQRDDQHRDLDIRPRTLLVPPELHQVAKQLLQSDFLQRIDDKQPTGNAMKSIVNLEVEPRLSNPQRFSSTSSKAWYLFGSPADMALVVAFLQGKQTPTVEFFGLDAEPNKLAASWRVYFDYGCALGDFRAAYRAKGEA